MEKVVLTDGEQIEIVVAKGKITVDSGGYVSVESEDQSVRGDLFHTFSSDQTNAACCNTAYTPSKADKIQQYLHMLLEVNKAGHKVNDEIGEALKQYKSELAI